MCPNATVDRFARVLGAGSYRPRRVVSNEEVAGPIGSSDAWIRARSGIRRRRWADDTETLSAMAAAAAEQALSRAAVVPGQVDCVLVASMTHMRQTPAAASEVAARIGAPDAAAFDVSAACAGFCYALALANDMVCGGSASVVLVVGAERMTDVLDHGDRGTAFVFGDGAGAVVVGPSHEPDIGPVVWGGDATRTTAITQDRSWTAWRRELTADSHAAWPSLRMQGSAVFRWATTAIVDVARRALKQAGIEVADLAAFIPHQANGRITDSLARSLGLPDGVVIARDVEEQGNTSAASIPLALCALLDTGAIRSGDRALLLGFGAGLTYAGQVVTVP
ncbi:MAG: beta-ketoacyl-ACP synthase 3 [Actinophytocola sp.]|uniref:beta-ketoacyl-ACP synthase 3 n=1 Tax=Actinophytocola sp. TaxID=1872138 RepID=UPI003D6A628D